MLAALVVPGFGTRSAAADTFAVGSACAHTTLASAVLAARLTPGDDLIKITEDLVNQAATFDDFDPAIRGQVTVRGGYSSCADTTATGLSQIDGITSKAVVLVQTTSAARSKVVLEALELEGALRAVEVTGGGEVALVNVNLIGNSQGARVEDGGSLSADALSFIFQNGWGSPAASGGGIDCRDGFLGLAAQIDNNHANVGGGIAVGSGCVAELHSGITLRNNYASSEGGGMHVIQGGLVVSDLEGVWFYGNSAPRGAAIYAGGADTYVILPLFLAAMNQATEAGSLVYAAFGASVLLTGASYCLETSSCYRVSGNFLQNESAGEGSLVYADDAQVGLARLRLRENWFGFPEPIAHASLLYATGDDGELLLENLEIWGNLVESIVRVEGGASVFGGYLSSAGNSPDPLGTTPSTIALSGAGTSGGFYSSTFWDHGGFVLGSGAPALTLDCLLVESTVGVPLGSSFIRTDTPQFADRAGGDLRSVATSPAVDFCDEEVYPYPGTLDIDRETRGFDHTSNANGSPGVGGGLFDIGFDELVPGGSAPIFSDDFESGNTGAWR